MRRIRRIRAAGTAWLPAPSFGTFPRRASSEVRACMDYACALADMEGVPGDGAVRVVPCCGGTM
jgi:hypothetical protein